MDEHMDIYILEYFRKVAEMESITKASMELHVGQPTLSKHMKQLEVELGTLLFERNGRRLRLTEAGRKLYLHVENILNEWGHAMIGLKALENVEKGSLSIAVFFTFLWYVLPRFLPGFIKEFPSVNLYIDRGYTERIVELVMGYHEQAGIVVSPVSFPKIKEIPLYKEEFVLLVPHGHAWYKRKSVNVKELSEYPIILSTLKNWFKDFMVPLRSGLADVQIRTNITIHDFDVVRKVVSAGVKQPALVTKLASYYWGNEDQSVRIVDLEPPIKRTISWIERVDRVRSPLCEAFFSYMVDYLKSDPYIESLL